MRSAAALVVLLALTTVPLAAQRRSGRDERSRNVPPGHLPPPGECRVWYPDLPAGQQPPPTSCREAESIAARDRYARVIYGPSRDGRDDGWRDRADDRRNPGRAIPRRTPSASPNRNRDLGGREGEYGYGSVPFDNGFRDGYAKGTEDARDNDAPDPVRHSTYRSAERGYDRRYGSKEEYKNMYRRGFRAGYEDGYRWNGRRR